MIGLESEGLQGLDKRAAPHFGSCATTSLMSQRQAHTYEQSGPDPRSSAIVGLNPQCGGSMEDWPVPRVDSSDMAALESEIAYESAVIFAN